MGLAGYLGSIFDRKNKLSPEALRLAVPQRNPDVKVLDEVDGCIVIEAPLEQATSKFMAGLARLTKQPNTKRFELEQVGSSVWKMIDGKRSFEGISKSLREQYKMSRVESDAALGAFLQMLAQRRLITLWIKGSSRRGKKR